MRINNETRSDLMWWKAFAGSWNGIGVLDLLRSQLLQFGFSQMPPALGDGGTTLQDSWLQPQWPMRWRELPVQIEMFPVVRAAFAWRRHRQGSHVLFESDNTTV